VKLNLGAGKTSSRASIASIISDVTHNFVTLPCLFESERVKEVRAPCILEHPTNYIADSQSGVIAFLRSVALYSSLAVGLYIRIPGRVTNFLGKTHLMCAASPSPGWIFLKTIT
jgi:hypothetical protein